MWDSEKMQMQEDLIDLKWGGVKGLDVSMRLKSRVIGFYKVIEGAKDLERWKRVVREWGVVSWSFQRWMYL